MARRARVVIPRVSGDGRPRLRCDPDERMRSFIAFVCVTAVALRCCANSSAGESVDETPTSGSALVMQIQAQADAGPAHARLSALISGTLNQFQGKGFPVGGQSIL